MNVKPNKLWELNNANQYVYKDKFFIKNLGESLISHKYRKNHTCMNQRGNNHVLELSYDPIHWNQHLRIIPKIKHILFNILVQWDPYYMKKTHYWNKFTLNENCAKTIYSLIRYFSSQNLIFHLDHTLILGNRS